MRGLFIPEITAEMFRNGCLESIETLMAEGEIYDIEYSRWIPITSRHMTEEEKKDFAERTGYDEKDFDDILSCPLPEDGETVLITDRLGNVEIDTFINDCDGCYFECNCDMEDVKAWMPLPEPYKAKGEELKPKRRMYKGCENCKNYQNRICMMTGEELAMVCEEWEAKDEQG